MCILPINIVNEKVYIFLWFWFYFLVVVSVLALIYRFFTFLYPRMRVMATHSHCRISNPKAIREVLKYGGIGDWFLLDMLSKNMDPLNFRDLILDLKNKFELVKDTKNGV